MSGLAKVFIALFLSLSFWGCSVGYDKTYCEENGKDYTDSGVCSGMIEIIDNSSEVIKRAYSNGGNCKRVRGGSYE